MPQPHRFQRKPLAAALGIALLPLMSSPVQAQLEEVVVTATGENIYLDDVENLIGPISGLSDQGVARPRA